MRITSYIYFTAYLILYLTPRLIIVFIIDNAKSLHLPVMNILRDVHSLISSIDRDFKLIILIYWLKSTTNRYKIFNSFKDDIKEKCFIYTIKMIFNLKKVFFSRIRDEEINVENFVIEDNKEVFKSISQKRLEGYSPTIEKIKTIDEVDAFINESIENYPYIKSLNFKIVYNKKYYIPFGPTVFEKLIFKRIDRLYKDFIYRVEREIVVLPIINFINNNQKTIMLEWNFDRKYKKSEKKIFKRFIKILNKKLGIRTIYITCFIDNLEFRKILRKLNFKIINEENNIVSYQSTN